MQLLQADFEQAQRDATQLAERPGDKTLLKPYALCKQGTLGDAQGRRPGMLDFVGRAKWDTWHALAGTPRQDAQRDYVALVHSLRAA